MSMQHQLGRSRGVDFPKQFRRKFTEKNYVTGLKFVFMTLNGIKTKKCNFIVVITHNKFINISLGRKFVKILV
jgi:hypothetical protein